MPITVAETVASPNRPLAAEIFSDRSSSGMLPILDGENKALCAPIKAHHEKQQNQVAIAGEYRQQSRHAERHDDDLGDLAADDDMALAEPIGQVAGRGGQHQIGDDEAGRPGHQDDADLRLVDVVLADADGQPAKHVVVDRRQQLGQQQRDEADRHQAATSDRLVRSSGRMPGFSVMRAVSHR